MESTKMVTIPKSELYIPYVSGYHFISMCKDLETKTDYIAKFISDQAFRNYYKNFKGQITLGTEFGNTLYSLMSQENGPTQWLEIGTWNGKGSTYCLLEGLTKRIEKKGVQFVSYEASPFFYEIANENLKEYECLASHFTLLKGQLPGGKPFPTVEEIKDKSEHFMINYAEEKYLYENAVPIYPPFLPEVAVLDGGEYSGERDWHSLPKENLKHVFLDDICVAKNKNVHETLKKESDWECILERTGDRNGWAYWRKQT